MASDNEKQRKRSVRGDKVSDPRTVRKFLEELSWVLSTYSNLDFRAIPELVQSSFAAKESVNLRHYASKNPNVHFLVGALPVIFADDRLFPSNEDIAEFAMGALSLPISRWEKRSRYELIGLIACETAKLNDAGLTRLVGALSRLTAGDTQARDLMEERRAKKMSWSEMIQRLTRE